MDKANGCVNCRWSCFDQQTSKRTMVKARCIHRKAPRNHRGLSYLDVTHFVKGLNSKPFPPVLCPLEILRKKRMALKLEKLRITQELESEKRSDAAWKAAQTGQYAKIVRFDQHLSVLWPQVIYLMDICKVAVCWDKNCKKRTGLPQHVADVLATLSFLNEEYHRESSSGRLSGLCIKQNPTQSTT